MSMIYHFPISLAVGCTVVIAVLMIGVPACDAGDAKEPLSRLGIFGEDDPVPSLALSADGKMLAVASGLSSSQVDRGKLRVFDTNSGKPIWSVDTGYPAKSCVFLKEPFSVVALCNRELQVWDANTGRALHRKAISRDHLLDLAVHQRLRVAAIAVVGGSVLLVALPEGKLLATLKHPQVEAVAMNQVTDEVVSLGGALIKKWSLKNHEMVQETKINAGGLGVVECSHDGKLLCAWTRRAPVEIRSWATLELKQQIPEALLSPGCARFTRDDQALVIPDEQNLVFFEPATGKTRASHTLRVIKSVRSLAVAADADTLACAGNLRPGDNRVEWFRINASQIGSASDAPP